MPPELVDYHWLTSTEGAMWLARAAEGGIHLTTVAGRLRRELTAARTHLVLEQLELRQRAKSKFALAGQMFFTRQGLEQATGEIPAAYKTGRYSTGSQVLDLCCGIGGDAQALAARGPLVGIDRDSVATLFAKHNCAAAGLPDTSFSSREAADANVAECAGWHIDPDRRPAGKRTSQVELGEPGLETLERLLTANNSAAIKLAPAAAVPDSWNAVAEREWLGDGGECRQQVAWFGALARHAGRRSATVLGSGGALRTVVETAGTELQCASEVGRYVFEPQAAILAARLGGVLAVEHGLLSIADHGGYLTGDKAVEDAGLAAFKVQEVLPFDLKRIKACLRERGIGRLEIKKRGIDEEPAILRKKLQVSGEESATLLITRVGERRIAILAQRYLVAGDIEK